MKTNRRLRLAGLATSILLGQIICAFASFVIPLSTADHIAASVAVCRGTVVGISSYRDSNGLIYTRTSLHVEEALIGKFPEVVQVVHRGGQVGNEDQYEGLSPRFVSGGEYLLFVMRGRDGKLHCTQGFASAIPLSGNATAPGSADSASQGLALLEEVRSFAKQNPNAGGDVTDQVGIADTTSNATTGMLGGVNTRFLQPDRGDPIPYLIDAASLPSGITLAQATNAVQQALNAWTAVTSLKFKLEGIQGFGQGADTITTEDEKLHIQLHDNYNRINTPNVLGIGGRSASTSPSPAGWDWGGNVAGNEFLKSAYGYVVLEAGNASMQNLATFTEVLCHEIGHALNMAHSSEVFTSDPVLFNSIMYYQAHADGRGAALGAYDPPIIRQAYPYNTVPVMPIPFPLHRVIDATTASVALNIAGINEVELGGYDLQSPSLTIITNNQFGGNGSFSIVGNKIKYNAPVGNFADSGRLDPLVELGVGFSAYLGTYARLSDGTNASPYTMVRVISLRRDSISPQDGIPDYWMVNYFGSSTPQAGNLSRATDDADGDGLKNLQEYRTGTNPKDSNSAVRIEAFTGELLQFPAQAYELYEIMGSTNLSDWRVVTPASPGSTSLAFRTSLPQTNILATVSNLPISSPQMFYRVRKVP